MKKAAVSIRVDDEAVRQLAARLAAVARSAAVQALKKGMNEVTREVLKVARPLVPRKTGQLRKSLGRTVRVRRDGKGVVGKVGPRGGFKVVVGGKPVNPAKYAHLVEFGRKALVPKKKKVLADRFEKVIFGRKVRAAAPRPFLRPAWDAVRPRVSEILARHLREGFRRFFAKRGVSAVA